MIKKFAINKIVLIFMYVFLLLTFYFLPSNNDIDLELSISDKKEYNNKVYLLDNDNYVSIVNIYYDDEGLENEIKYKINVLINGVNDSNFYPLLPKNTKLNYVKIDKNSVYLDFNDSIKNVSNVLCEKMIESIIYTLTDINGINNIYLTVNNELLDTIGNIKLTYPLTRNFGINKKYNLNNLNNISKTTVYFLKENNSNEYYVPITIVSNNDDQNKIDIIVKELKSSFNSQNNLNGYVNSELDVIKYELIDNKMNIVFNDYIFSDNNKNVLEEVKHVISYSIFENYEVNNVTFSTHDKSNIASIDK